MSDSLRRSLRGLGIDFLQMGGLLVEAHGVGRADELAIDRPVSLTPLHLAGEGETAIGSGLALSSRARSLPRSNRGAGDIARRRRRILEHWRALPD